MSKQTKKTNATEPVKEAEAPNTAETEKTEPAADSDITLTKQEFDMVKSHVEKLQKDNETLTDTAKRVQAEFDNYRRRNANLHKDSVDEGVRMVITQLLPVLDNYERAIAAIAPDDRAKFDGVLIIYKQLLASLEKVGLSEIDATGKFDPNLHDAIMQAPAEGCESGDIVEVFQKGYKVNERIIRHSMVKVAE